MKFFQLIIYTSIFLIIFVFIFNRVRVSEDTLDESFSSKKLELQLQEQNLQTEILNKSNQNILYQFSNGILSWEVQF